MTREDRFWAKVRKTETCWLWTAGLHSTGYGQFRGLAHRYSYELLVGPIPPGLTIDHRDSCPRHCVNPEHLRLATYKQNNENRPGAMRNSKSRVRGVYWGKDRGKWRVLVYHNEKKYAGGDFDDLTQAEAAAIALRNRLFTHNDADRVST